MSTIQTAPLELLTVPEVAAVLRVSRATTYKLIEAGSIPSHRVGGSIRVERGEMLDALALRPVRLEDEIG